MWTWAVSWINAQPVEPSMTGEQYQGSMIMICWLFGGSAPLFSRKHLAEHPVPMAIRTCRQLPCALLA
jgi:hypothetical protein